MKTAPVIELSSLANAEPVILLDVREQGAFDAAHSAGAVRVPIEVWEAAAKTDETSLENVRSVAAVAAGFSHVQAYYLSFADWARHETCSVVR